jgi:hypothetical protein
MRAFIEDAIQQNREEAARAFIEGHMHDLNILNEAWAELVETVHIEKGRDPYPYRIGRG